MAPQKIIIDTDPGVDDVFALLLALSASPEEIELLLISLTFGNIDVESCLRNTVSLFHVLDLERIWRIENGKQPGFGALESSRPIVAVGADRPLEGVIHEYDYFHGKDGLGNVHTKAPHFTPTEMWKHLFQSNSNSSTPARPVTPSGGPTTSTDQIPPPEPTTTQSGPSSPLVALPPNFRPSARQSHIEILDQLSRNPPNTVTIIAVGPLTNIALAASTDLNTFLRAKEVICMGGAIAVPGNVTPLAEFNHWACAYSAAQVYAYTSPSPASTLPCGEIRNSWPKDKKLSEEERLNLTVFTLDITTRHLLRWSDVQEIVAPLAEKGSPLAAWMKVFAESTFGRIEGVYESELDLALHDPVCVWYVMTQGKGWEIKKHVDVRVEAEGQWTRGMCIVDKRGKRVVDETEAEMLEHDKGGWLHKGLGNRVNLAYKGTDEEAFGRGILERIFRC